MAAAGEGIRRRNDGQGKKVVMVDAIIWAYLLGWAVTGVGLALSSQVLAERRRRQPHPVAVSFLAGAAWPLLLLGVVEYGALAAASRFADSL